MADTPLTLALDQGTHSTRAVVYDARGNAVALARRPVALQRPDRARVEQSPFEILATLYKVIEEVLHTSGIDPGHIQAAGLATQRSSVLAWERDSGTALSPLLSWQDTRTAAWIATLAEHDRDVRQRTGLPLSPHYGAGKLRWLLDNNPEVAASRRQGRLVAGPLAAWLLHHLLQDSPDTVDHANASRTLLWNLQSRDWDDTLLALFGIPRAILPDCRPVCAEYGTLHEARIPVTAVNGDQTAALYARGEPDGQVIRVNIGTGAFVLLPTGDRLRQLDGLLSGMSAGTDAAGTYYLEGTVNGAGAALRWLERRHGISDWQERLPEWLGTVHDPPLFLNTIGGLGSPWWRTGPEPGFVSATGTVTPAPAQAVVAVIESILFLVQANLDRLRRENPAIRRIHISGGLAQSDGLCRRLADLSGLDVERGTDLEATARGIAWLAAGRPAAWLPHRETTTRFAPQEQVALRERYARFLETLQE